MAVDQGCGRDPRCMNPGDSGCYCKVGATAPPETCPCGCGGPRVYPHVETADDGRKRGFVASTPAEPGDTLAGWHCSAPYVVTVQLHHSGDSQ